MTANLLRNKPINILLVEDSPSDIYLTKRALSNSSIKNDLQVARDGVEAMSYLKLADHPNERALPDLILLDLNLPRKNGQEVLSEIKSDKRLAHLPVVILSTSDSDRDVLRSYQLHANSYVVKPADASAFLDAVKSIEKFWFSLAKLPEDPSTSK